MQQQIDELISMQKANVAPQMQMAPIHCHTVNNTTVNIVTPGPSLQLIDSNGEAALAGTPALQCKQRRPPRCVEAGCTKSAQGKTDKCIEHGGGRRCVEAGCTKSAQGTTDKCKQHGGGRRCVEAGCTKSAVGTTDKCVEHGGGRRCVEAGCIKSARDTTDKCVEHGGGRRCVECITWPDSHCGQKQYEMGDDWYCARCFKRKFPEDPRSAVIYEHTKEIAVRNALAANFVGFIHDHPLYTANCDCTHRRRVDHRKLIGNTILAIETDEWGHRNYDEKDEEIRYHDLYMLHSGKWLFIRFNPDVMGARQEPLAERFERLVAEVAMQTGRIEREENVELLEVIKLYY